MGITWLREFCLFYFILRVLSLTFFGVCVVAYGDTLMMPNVEELAR